MVRFPTMRPRQAAIIWAATALIVGMTIYPPWACVETRGLRSATGYHWFFTHPEGICLAANLDYPRLLIQWAVASLVAAALYLAWPPPAFFFWSAGALKGLFSLAVIACLAWLFYGICEELQPRVASALPVGWRPKGPHWLFGYGLFTALAIYSLAGKKVVLVDKIKHFVQSERRD